MVLPSIIITLFLLLGFQREYESSINFKYSSQILGSNIGNATDLNADQMTDIINNMATLTGHGDRGSDSKNQTAFAEKGAAYFKDIMDNPTLPNILKNIMEMQNEDDEEFKEVKDFIGDLMKEDLKMDSPFELMTYGMSLMMKDETERSDEMQQIAVKVQARVTKYYQKKM